MGSPLDVRSLRQQIYQYLQKEIHAGRLVPGSLIKLNEISAHLGVSETPLRDAIIQMEYISDKLIKLIERDADQLTKNWLSDARNRPTTPT